MSMIIILILAGYLAGILYWIDELEIPDSYNRSETIWYGLGALASTLVWPILIGVSFIKGFMQALITGESDEEDN